jgi:DNA-binding transcriptional MerR regulator
MARKAREDLLKISEMAEKAEVLVSTIRYYTDIGLLKAAMTTEGGHRLYEEAVTMDRLGKIKRMVAKGLTLPEIQSQIDSEMITKKILVVDDEPEIGISRRWFFRRTIGQHIFSRLGYFGFIASRCGWISSLQDDSRKRRNQVCKNFSGDWV